METLTLVLEIVIVAFVIVGGWYILNQQRALRKNLQTREMYVKLEENTSKNWQGEASALIEKREEFFRINSFFLKMLSEKKSKSNYKRMQKEYMELGTRLYFYASENTIRKFLEFKHLSAYVEGTVHEHKIVLLWFAEFNLLLRKDLGLATPPELIKEYLNILLTYWEDEEMKEEELNQLKVELSQSIDNYYSVYQIGTSLN